MVVVAADVCCPRALTAAGFIRGWLSAERHNCRVVTSNSCRAWSAANHFSQLRYSCGM